MNKKKDIYKLNPKRPDYVKVALNNSNSFTIRENPCDEKAFGFKTTEIFDLQYTDKKIFEKIDRTNEKIKAGFCCIRYDSNDLRVKRDLIDNGFYIAETSLEVYARLSKIKSKKYFDFSLAREEHIKILQDLVGKNFRGGRFLEDVLIDAKKAVKRHENWIINLVKSDRCLIAKDGENNIIGFFSYSIEKNEIDLVLAGISSEYQGYGVFFFSSIIEYLKPLGKTIRAIISSANINIINIYAQFGFTFRKSLTGFHKIY